MRACSTTTEDARKPVEIWLSQGVRQRGSRTAAPRPRKEFSARCHECARSLHVSWAGWARCAAGEGQQNGAALDAETGGGGMTKGEELYL
jgi:hypothetical protein